MREVNYVEVTYLNHDGSPIRLGADGENLKATPYEMSPDDMVAYGLKTDVRRREYIINVADIPGVEPTQGDFIQDGDLMCAVVPRGDEPCFRYTTNQRLAVRIHTVVVS